MSLRHALTVLSVAALFSVDASVQGQTYPGSMMPPEPGGFRSSRYVQPPMPGDGPSPSDDIIIGEEVPMGEELGEGEVIIEDGSLSPQMDWIGPHSQPPYMGKVTKDLFLPKHFWRFEVVPRYTYISDNLSLRNFFFQGFPIQGPNAQGQNLLGASFIGEVGLTDFIRLTTSADVAGTTGDDSFGVGTGAHAAFSFLINVDPTVENIYYGAGIDVYLQPALDVTEVTGSLGPVVSGQARGGAGISTEIGNVFVRGAGRMENDQERFDDVLIQNPDGSFTFSARNVGFVTEHWETGIETQIGCLIGSFYVGYRSHPDTQYFAMDWEYLIPQRPGAKLVGDFYIDEIDNLSFSIGLAIPLRPQDRTFRHILKPMTVGRANRLQNYGIFEFKTSNNPPN